MLSEIFFKYFESLEIFNDKFELNIKAVLSVSLQKVWNWKCVNIYTFHIKMNAKIRNICVETNE